MATTKEVGVWEQDSPFQTLTPGGRGTPLYKPYRYVPPQRVGFLSRFGLKTGIDFVHFGLESGTISEGTSWTTGMYERVYRLNSKYARKKAK